ncbi:MAG TPA: urea carboxylase [Tepidisphaeraceae bacterium]|nr:urea carboxylase [Tepidisphaeraceae bacterium]
MFKKILIANRGEIACRVIRTLDKMGIASVAVYSEADAQSAHVSAAGQAVRLGPSAASESYLRGALIIESALASGAEAIHPGYGFLSENPEFAQMCADAGIVFVGPTPQQMRSFGLKHAARELARRCEVPMAPGSGLLDNPAQALKAARKIGLPVMLKATAGGGGIGMRLCRQESELADAFAAVQRLGKSNFKHAGLYLEKYIDRARHIEVQIFGDGRGNVVALGERDCSTQRRNQKVIEETPAPGIGEEMRWRLFAAAVKLGKAVSYQSAGTVEFIFDADADEFYFLEVNTRLQVEHGVTEMVTGIDLVEWMIRQAAGELSLEGHALKSQGASMQVRVYAEDPAKNFQPSCGVLTDVQFPTTARVDTWVTRGVEVSSFYDPLVAKIIVHGDSRGNAIAKMRETLDQTHLSGIESNLEYLRRILDEPAFVHGQMTTQLLSRFSYQPQTIEVVKPGTQTTVQDYPGRIGYWAIGVPPSGPMDSLAFRLANRIVGNPPEAAGLEVTVTGPTLRFNVATTIAITGAEMNARLDEQPVAMWAPIRIPAGSLLELKAAIGPGSRCYIAFAGGLDVPKYLGSGATFTLGKFGGHGGRALRAGDALRLGPAVPDTSRAPDPTIIPTYNHNWEVAVLYGPHGAPDFFTQEDIDMLFATAWRVHHHSDRTGVRLIGPHPKWARKDGGEAGLHPSNIHDNAYAIGTIDFTGNLPILLGPDGPSLGGFVCPATIVQADLWKMGQFKAGDTVRFRCVTADEARRLEEEQESVIATLQGSKTSVTRVVGSALPTTPILGRLPESSGHVGVVYRQDGDKYLLVEYGPLALDLNLRFRVHALQAYLENNPLPGILDLTPGIRSLHIHFDSRILPRDKLMDILIAAEDRLPKIDEIEVPTRIVHLPLSWDDPATQLAIQRYMQVVRKDAPWCPSNLEFIRRINGLRDIDEVKRIVFDANYIVLGLGDVYLGAPVATPIDPRHRLVTTKYNPARTWTPENAVGIGGAYLCVYGMEGPGGYQFVGRTCQMWNTFRQTADFTDDKPWLLRFFDQIRFYAVSANELLRFREDFLAGRAKLQISHEIFRLREYNQFLQQNQKSISAFKAKRQKAFDEERHRWEAAGQMSFATPAADDESAGDSPGFVPQEGAQPVFADVPGILWKIETLKGQHVRAGQKLAILESMKMEIEVTSPSDGLISDIYCEEGRMISAGQVLFALRPASEH